MFLLGVGLFWSRKLCGVKKEFGIKAVIPAAGVGRRLYPYSKIVPKELFPLVNRPIIDFVLDEIVEAGVEQVGVVVNVKKKLLNDYLKNVSLPCQLIFQDQPIGLGDAVFTAQRFVGKSGMLVALPDNLFDKGINVSSVLIKRFWDQDCCAVVALYKVDGGLVYNYGIADVFDSKGDLTISKIVEKPEVGQAPSNLAVAGRYIFSPCIFYALRQINIGVDGELQLTDAINVLLDQGKKILGVEIPGKFFDAGSVCGWINANNEFFKKECKKQNSHPFL